ncbi:MAG: hypothetical protein GY805_22630, partial [Chloroflexi bacterium]|nr:hypothetical protein [Chloroflexota bacterium]
MSRTTKFHATSLFILILLVFTTLFSQVACSSSQRIAAVNAAAAISNEVDAKLEEPSELVFAGQIETEDGRWQNNFVVVLFQNGEEKARTTSSLLDAPLSERGPMDGVFELRIRNEYKLSDTHIFYDQDSNETAMRPVSGMVGTQYIGIWYDDLNPMGMR